MEYRADIIENRLSTFFEEVLCGFGTYSMSQVTLIPGISNLLVTLQYA